MEELLKKCPFCAEEIRKEAILCRFCGRDLETGKQEKKEAQSKIADGVKLGFGMFFVLPLIIIGSIIFVFLSALNSTKGYGTAIFLAIFVVVLLFFRSKRKD